MAAAIRSLARRVLPDAFWARLRLWRQRRRIARFPARVVQHIYGGIPLVVHLQDPLAEGWYDHDWPVLEEIELLRRHRLREGALVFDLGAHQGVVALMLAATVGPRGRVIAVEANTHNSAIAALNCRENRALHVSVVTAAVGERSGMIDFGQGLNGRVAGYGGNWGRVPVRAATVDELAYEFGFPDVVFVDVEGWEQHLMRGATETLRRRPDWFVEVHAGGTLEAAGSSVKGVLAFFPPEEFELLASSEQRDFRPLDRAALPEERFLLVALPREPGVVDQSRDLGRRAIIHDEASRLG